MAMTINSDKTDSVLSELTIYNGVKVLYNSINSDQTESEGAE